MPAPAQGEMGELDRSGTGAPHPAALLAPRSCPRYPGANPFLIPPISPCTLLPPLWVQPCLPRAPRHIPAIHRVLESLNVPIWKGSIRMQLLTLRRSWNH